AQQAGQQAAQMLDRAAQQAAQAAQQMAGGGQPQGAQQAGQALQQGQKQVGEAQGELGQGQPQGAQAAMQQAAQAPQQAAGSAQQTAQQGQKPGQPSLSKQPGPLGAAGVGLPDLSMFGPEAKKYAGRPWGELPGELRTRILQDMRARYGEDYARIIQRYFEQIADTRN